VSDSKNELTFLSKLAAPTGRRQFLTWAGISISVVAAAVGCGGGGGNNDEGPNFEGDIGSGDIGVLNYAYALEQLEAAFYVKVISAPYAKISTSELAILTDIRDHEVIHRDFLKAALGKDAIPDLTVDFSSIDFTSRSSVLNAAKAFEDLGVSAYNGAGRLLENPDYLLLAGKIVSVEARHASVIRDLLAPKSASFAGDDVVDPVTGLDVANSPSIVLAAADTYVVTTISADRLPQS